MSIAKELLVVTVRVDADVEPAWNDWYNDVHLPEIAACPGFYSAQRYVAERPEGRFYITLYELASSDALKSAEFAARRGWGPFTDNVEFSTAVYSRITQIDNSGVAV